MAIQTSTPDFNDDAYLKEYLGELTKNGSPFRHQNYDSNMEHAKEMAVHIKGEAPKELLETRRPREDNAAHTYRLEVFQPITKSKAKKVINTLARIKNSKNFSIDFPEKNGKISEEESLKAYTMDNFPAFKSLQNWLFTIVLKQDLLDPNSICIWLPYNLMEVKNDDTKYLKPIPFIYECESVLDFESGIFYTVMMKEKNVYKNGSATVEGDIIHIYTKNEIISATEIDQKDGKKIFSVETLYTHNFGETPVIELRGEFVENCYPFRYESFIAGVLPFWNDALRLNSDLQVQYTNHMYLERVEIMTECHAEGCGVGVERGYCLVENRRKPCSTCNGSGYISGRGPFSTTVVKSEDGINPDNQTIFPGVTYVQKPIDIIQETKKEVTDLISQGLSAINMDIISEVGANQSGVAKTIDRTDMDSFIGEVSNNLFRILEESFSLINKWRYGVILKGDELYKNLPQIVVPINFDVISSNAIIDEMQKATTSKLGSPILQKMNVDFADKRYNDPDFTKFVKNLNELDPLSGNSGDEKGYILANKGASMEDYILSSKINSFMLEAIENNKGFLDMKRDEKLTILYDLVKKQMASSSSDVMPIVDANGQQQQAAV